MAGDWIKVEKLTPDKPELMAVARECGCSPGDAFAAWFRLWAYFDSATEDGTVRFMSASDADRLGTLSGLGAAMERTGWLTFDADGCHVSRWSRHNGQSAKRRAVDAERKRQQRKAGIEALREAAERPQNVRTESGHGADAKRSDCGPEKRREEKSIRTSPPRAQEPEEPVTEEPDLSAALAALKSLRPEYDRISAAAFMNAWKIEPDPQLRAKALSEAMAALAGKIETDPDPLRLIRGYMRNARRDWGGERTGRGDGLAIGQKVVVDDGQEVTW